jgi:hypothetical protein
MGFCGLDRKRVPLRGDEVRACWEDGSMPPPPDPATPGLLDLLTVQPLAGAQMSTAGNGAVAGPATGARREPSGHRMWVEVEV